MTQTAGQPTVFDFHGTYVQRTRTAPLGEQRSVDVTDGPGVMRQAALSRLEQIIEYLRVLYR